MHQARLQSEEEARSPQTTHNHLLASSLSDLLEDLKYSKTREDLPILSRRYDVDVAKIESLARFVNTPTVDPNNIIRVVGDDGTETITTEVCVSGSVVVVY